MKSPFNTCVAVSSSLLAIIQLNIVYTQPATTAYYNKYQDSDLSLPNLMVCHPHFNRYTLSDFNEICPLDQDKAFCLK